MQNKSALMLVFSGVILLFTEFLRLFNAGVFFNFRMDYNRSIIEPLEILMVVFFVSGMYLFMFSKRIQNLWWRWFRFTLLLPVIPILIFLPERGGGGGFISFGGTVDAASLWGVVVGCITVLYTLYHRFYLKTGVAK